jgi:hypothetical protein
MQKATAERPEAAGQADANEVLALADGIHPVDAGDILNDADAEARQTGRTLIAEVDRRPALRAR